MAVSLTLIVLMPLFFGFVVNKRVQLHFGEIDTSKSPQQELKETMGMESDDYIEDMPTGYLTFGDTFLTKEQKKRIFNESPGSVNDLKLRWRNGEIPFVIDCSLEKLDDAASAIKAAMDEWERQTCITFVERSSEDKYLRFFRDTHCWSHVGGQDSTYISVGYGCEYKNVLMHQIGHVLGLYHVHNRKDRDDNIVYQQGNVETNFKDVFLKAKKEFASGVKYDYGSIMHFPWNAYAASDNTLYFRPFDDVSSPPYTTISATDVKQISELYSCGGKRKKRSIRDNIDLDGAPPDDDGRSKFSVISSPRGTPGCVDWSPNCDLIVSACKTKDYIREKCKRSCDQPLCYELVSCDTADTSKSRCAKWAQSSKRYCTNESYKKYMATNCCQTCKDFTKREKAKKCKGKDQFCNDDNKEWCKACDDKEPTVQTVHPCDKGDKGGCDHTCGKNGDKADCSCNPGYRLGLDEKSCEEVVHPCDKADKGGCDHTCVKNGDKAECSCNPGYNLGSDEKSCEEVTKVLPEPQTCKPGCKNIRDDCMKMESYCEGSMNAWMERNCCGTCNCKDTGGSAKKGPREIAITLKKVKRKFLGTGRLCDSSRGISENCDQPGLQPDGICTNPLGLAYDGTNSRKISHSAFTSARGYLTAGNWYAKPENARLYFEDEATDNQIGGWCADTDKITTSTLQSLTVNIGSRKRITHIATQGRAFYYERVSQFKIEFSTDGYNFSPYKQNGKEKIFDGNCDHKTPVLNEFVHPVFAQYIKYIPWKFNYPCVRMELYGCNLDEKQPDP